jgi:hypothetical protein
MRRNLAVVLLFATMLAGGFLAGCDDGAPSDANKTSAERTGPVEQLLSELDAQGQVVLVQFASWGDARGDVNLQRLDKIARRRAVPGLAVGRVELGMPELIDGLLNQKGVKVPGVGENAGQYAAALGVTDTPACVLLDRGGHVHYRGAMPGEHLLAEWLKRLQDRPADAGPPEELLDAAAADTSALAATNLPDLETGRKETLRSFVGQAGLVVVFVDTTCEFSGTALADVQGVSNELDSFDVPLVVVNIGNPLEKVEQYYGPENVHLHVPVLYDTTNGTRDRWRVKRVPTVMYFRPDGMVTYRGLAVWDDLAAGIAADLGVDADEIIFEQEGTSYG